MAAVQLHQFNVGVSFVATATTHYLGMGFAAIEPSGSGQVTVTVNASASIPLLLYWFEIQGNVRGTVT